MNIRNLKSNGWIWNYVQIKLEKVVVSAVRWPFMEIDCTGLDKIINNSNNVCKIIRNDM